MKAETDSNSDPTPFNAEEINKLKSFLKSMQDGSCSLTQLETPGKCTNSVFFSTLNTDQNDVWILDSGTIDHMTPNPCVFSTYQPLKTTKMITITNGTTVPIVGHGSVDLSPNLSIKPVLHVPHLSINLLSIHQLTKTLNC